MTKRPMSLLDRNELVVEVMRLRKGLRRIVAICDADQDLGCSVAIGEEARELLGPLSPQEASASIIIPGDAS